MTDQVFYYPTCCDQQLCETCHKETGHGEEGRSKNPSTVPCEKCDYEGRECLQYGLEAHKLALSLMRIHFQNIIDTIKGTIDDFDEDDFLDDAYKELDGEKEPGDAY